MMRKSLFIVVASFVLIGVLSYYIFIEKEQTHIIGKVQIKGISNLYFDLEQENDFDMATAIYYGISTESNLTVAPMKFLIGTHDYIENSTGFSAASVDSIVYLTWGDTTEVYAVYDLRTGNGYPNRIESWEDEIQIADSLAEILKHKKPYLIANWNK